MELSGHELSAGDRQLLAALEDGLPLVPRPYAALAARLGRDESEVTGALRRLREVGIIRRFGVIVRHHEVGYRDNAMVTWDVPDARVAALGQRLAEFDFVTLCYRRPRRLPDWPYNLFCMIHGRDRATVLAQIEKLRAAAGTPPPPHAILFSRRRFKQRGARYGIPLAGRPA